jgi:hypothetical protein
MTYNQLLALIFKSLPNDLAKTQVKSCKTLARESPPPPALCIVELEIGSQNLKTICLPPQNIGGPDLVVIFSYNSSYKSRIDRHMSIPNKT